MLGIGQLIAGAAFLAALPAGLAIHNPRPRGDISAPPKVESTLRRACFDCHSDETRWPWYAHIAPVSWIVVHDVTLGRKEVNFSEWGSYYPATRRRKLKWIGRALHDEKMPPWPYRLIHPDARLTAADQVELQKWIESTLASPSTETSSR
jgi:hypothetical protein